MPNSAPITSRTSANSALHFLPKAELRLASAGILSLTITPSRHFFQPIKSTSGRIRVMAMARSAFSAPYRLAPDRSARDRSEPDRSAPDRSAPDSSAPDSSARDRSAPDRS